MIAIRYLVAMWPILGYYLCLLYVVQFILFYVHGFVCLICVGWDQKLVFTEKKSSLECQFHDQMFKVVYSNFQSASIPKLDIL